MKLNKKQKAIARMVVLLMITLLYTGGNTQAQITHTFTSAGASGSVGPTQIQLNTAYGSTNLNGLVDALSTGIQSFTVPQTALYRIEAAGASGGNRLGSPNRFGGLGAYVSGEFNLTQGDVLHILVGQKGVDGTNTGAGGGGSFITSNGVLLIAAGAGGGATGDNDAANGTTLTAGTVDFPGGSIPGGTAGSGGGVCNNSGTNHGGGGGGYSGDGATSTLANAAGGGLAFVNGGIGGASTVPGGFGGGGGATMSGAGLYGGGGGGGGYSGGAGGQQLNHCTAGIARSGGGGGGSFNGGTNQSGLEGANTGDGYVILSRLCNVSASALSNPICIGESVVLNTNAQSNISWSSGGTGNSETVTPTVTTSYSVTGTGDNNCVTTAVITITVNPVPDLQHVVTPSVLCGGNTASLIATGAVSYSWEPGSFTGSVNAVSPAATTIYTLTGENIHTCVSSQTVAVIVDNSVLTVSSNTSVCAGSAATLTASGALQYLWSNGSALPQNIVFPTANTLYTVSAVNVHGCTVSNSVMVTVNPLPQLNISAERVTICKGENASLTASGAQTYSWSNGDTGPVITPVPSVDVLTHYGVTGTDVNGCSGTASIIIDVQACLGITESGNSKSGLAIYPNPSQGQFRVASERQLTRISVVDITGKVIFDREVNSTTANIDIRNTPAGLYYVLAEFTEGQAQMKLIID